MEKINATPDYQIELNGKSATLYYKPTAQSRTWRRASVSTQHYAEYSYRYGLAVQQQEGWHEITWIPK